MVCMQACGRRDSFSSRPARMLVELLMSGTRATRAVQIKVGAGGIVSRMLAFTQAPSVSSVSLWRCCTALAEPVERAGEVGEEAAAARVGCEVGVGW